MSGSGGGGFQKLLECMSVGFAILGLGVGGGEGQGSKVTRQHVRLGRRGLLKPSECMNGHLGFIHHSRRGCMLHYNTQLERMVC